MNRFPTLTLLALMTVLPGMAALADAPKTMRLDYFHTGSRTSEIFSLDRVVLEPLPWPGNPARPVDTLLRGKYLFEVREPESGRVLYSRSYSSVYAEWETTAEAREISRTFHESLRFPAPDRPVDVVVLKRNANQQFGEVWRAWVDPGDYLVHREVAPYTDAVIAIEHHGDPSHKVDVLFLGDGYTPDEHEDFVAKVRQATDLLLATAPFSDRRDDFNVWALAPPAAESGVSRPSSGIYRDTPLGLSYDAFRIERYMLTFDNAAFRRIAASAPYEFVVMLSNSETYGGGGILGQYSTASADNEWMEYLVVHEFAHHFAGLADEYYTSAVAYEAPEQLVEPYEPNVTAMLDPAGLKWKHLLDDGTPLPTPWPKESYDENSLAYQARRAQLRAESAPESEMNKLFRENERYTTELFSRAEYRDRIGAFEGANYLSQGYYRSALNCLMFTRSADFCPVCSHALVEVIDQYVAR
ncbi:MAG: IgA Peptidase M64 [Gammaproteobacteria bacterium]|nr:IgA Peptidase M64 [Gammaproteobacteria bacterium]MDH4255601.1 IgA Peptidase M64 [Gammaproteobacteria bacterium]MDH5310993.1 IgA Peptidase M64 [Gammaproteobacteria bacterium]